MVFVALRTVLTLFLLLALVTGVIYPLTVTGLAQALFNHQANGSLVWENGQVVGSALIGQAFTIDKYFHPRPSAAGAGYDGMASSGSNLGPNSKALVDRVAQSVAPYADQGVVPVDLVTTSASGLDPHISPAAAEIQISRVAKARSLPENELRDIVTAAVTPRFLGLMGEPVVNVLALNRQLDQLADGTR